MTYVYTNVNINYDTKEYLPNIPYMLEAANENEDFGSGLYLGKVTDYLDPAYNPYDSKSTFHLFGPDAKLFELRNGGIYYVGPALDFESKSDYDFSVSVNSFARTATYVADLSNRSVNSVGFIKAKSIGWDTDNPGGEIEVGPASRYLGKGTVTVIELESTQGAPSNIYKIVDADQGSILKFSFAAVARSVGSDRYQALQVLHNGNKVAVVDLTDTKEWKQFEFDLISSGGDQRIELKALNNNSTGEILKNLEIVKFEPFSTPQEFIFPVNNVNEAPSRIEFSNDTLTIPENTPIGAGGYKLSDLVVVDPDGQGNSNILSLSGEDASRFAIRDGALYFIGSSPDYEAKRIYKFNVESHDVAADGSALTKLQEVIVQVTDVPEPVVLPADFSHFSLSSSWGFANPADIGWKTDNASGQIEIGKESTYGGKGSDIVIELEARKGDTSNIYTVVDVDEGGAFTLNFEASARANAGKHQKIDILLNGNVYREIDLGETFGWKKFAFDLTSSGGDQRVELRAGDNDSVGELVKGLSLTGVGLVPQFLEQDQSVSHTVL